MTNFTYTSQKKNFFIFILVLPNKYFFYENSRF